MKQTYLCIGSPCFQEDNFEEINCAEPLTTADSEDPLSLGPDQPGCEGVEYCEETGLALPCSEVSEYEGSATVDIEWPEIDTSDLIPQPWDQQQPTAQVDVDESYMPYIT
jgi:hypothetical protein